MRLGKNTLGQVIDLAKNAEKRITISYAPNNANTTEWSFNAGFAFTPEKVEQFDLKVAGYEQQISFADDFTITVPFNAVDNTVVNAPVMTAVYVLNANGVAEKIENVTTKEGKNVVFSVPHFSDYIIVNEYAFSVTFNKNGVATFPVANGYIPAGVSVEIKPQLSAGVKITSIKNGTQALKLGDSITVNAPVALSIDVASLDSNSYWYVNGKVIVNDETTANAELAVATAPDGYAFVLNNGVRTWNTYELGTDIHYLPAMVATNANAKVFTIYYEGDNATPVILTYANYSVLAAETGYEWVFYTDAAYTSAVTANIYNVAEIAALSTTTFYAKAAAKTYNVYDVNGEKIGSAVFGTEYSFDLNNAEKIDGYKAVSVTYIEAATGNKIAVKNGKITVPASDIKVEVSYEAIPVEGQTNSTDRAQTSTDLSKINFVKEELVRKAWPWIVLIALVVIIGLIALFYSLYIREKLKPNPVLKGVTWIVSMFFNACIALSSLVLLAVQGTKKKGEVNYEEFGMANPEDMKAETSDEVVEANADEAVADEAVEAFETVETDEVSADDAATEVVEKVVEEATEAVDEAVAEVVAETVAEAVAEEATEETVEAEEVVEATEATETTEEESEN